ncbi:MAG: HAMP domain-containing protein [Acidobacteriales bacterium]|nr:HAMP domain-containing protein [Terriglobales bacterium]
MARFSIRFTLLWKILFSTSIAITLIFALTAWLIVNHTAATTSQSLEDEVKASFQVYRSLWQSRAQRLSSVSLILSAMSDVRAAFSTGDEATIRDTARELWSRISDSDAIFLVTDPQGRVIASLGGDQAGSLPKELDVVARASKSFPKQGSGFLARGERLYHIIITPVYVQTTGGTALLDVLVAGYDVDSHVANSLKQSTGGSEFVFEASGRVIASTLDSKATAAVVKSLEANPALRQVSDGANAFAPLITPLQDVDGRPVGRLVILRSFETVRQHLQILRRDIILLWLLSMGAGLALTYVLARRIILPVRELDRAAAEVARQNYEYRVPVRSRDELGRLARTFNAMCASISKARDELIRQERISTIGRLSTSIVHDLRNPLAAIYGGAEMLVDSDLPQPQVKRLAANIYHASRRIQELLQELVNVSGGKSQKRETASLRAVAEAACESLAASAEARGVSIEIDIPESIELPLEYSRVERVFANLIGNALEVMPHGGSIRICAALRDATALVEVRDTGPGVPPDVRDRLFQPFTSAGKQGGLGIGLALARQTILDHGGDMWLAQEDGAGACFRFRLPVRPNAG